MKFLTRTLWTASLQGIRRRSLALSQVCLFLTLTLPLGLTLYWVLADAPVLLQQFGVRADALLKPLQPWQRVAGFAITGVPLALLLMGLQRARQSLVQFASGELFSRRAVRGVQQFAAWVAASVVAGVLAQVACSALLTWGNPPGMRQLVLSLTTDVLFTLLFAAMVTLMASVVGQAQALAEENARFV